MQLSSISHLKQKKKDTNDILTLRLATHADRNVLLTWGVKVFDSDHGILPYEPYGTLCPPSRSSIAHL